MWWIPVCDPDDSIYSLNGMHGKLSKKYLDNFPEDRSAGDMRDPTAETGVFPSEKRLKVTFRAPVSKGRGSTWLRQRGQSVEWLVRTQSSHERFRMGP